MHRSSWHCRTAWMRKVALAFAAFFAWSFILAPPATALSKGLMPKTQYPILNTKHRGSGYRMLTNREMASIRGSQHTLSVSAASGTAYPWEGSFGGVNSGDGNRLTSEAIVAWTQRGGMPVN